MISKKLSEFVRAKNSSVDQPLIINGEKLEDTGHLMKHLASYQDTEYLIKSCNNIEEFMFTRLAKMLLGEDSVADMELLSSGTAEVFVASKIVTDSQTLKRFAQKNPEDCINLGNLEKIMAFSLLFRDLDMKDTNILISKDSSAVLIDLEQCELYDKYSGDGTGIITDFAQRFSRMSQDKEYKIKLDLKKFIQEIKSILERQEDALKFFDEYQELLRADADIKCIVDKIEDAFQGFENFTKRKKEKLKYSFKIIAEEVLPLLNNLSDQESCSEQNLLTSIFKDFSTDTSIEKPTKNTEEIIKNTSKEEEASSQYAEQGSSYQIMKDLFYKACGLKPNDPGDFSLRINQLVEDINALDPNGESILLIATRNKKLDVAKELLEMGADKIAKKTYYKLKTSNHWHPFEGEELLISTEYSSPLTGSTEHPFNQAL